jgi:hypothetical protein
MPDQRDRLTATVDQLQAEVDAMNDELRLLGLILGLALLLLFALYVRGAVQHVG